MKTVVVTGGRSFGCAPLDTPPELRAAAEAKAKRERDFVFKTLNEFHAKNTITTLHHGNARGVDRLCGEWASQKNIKVITHIPDWDRFGKGAGHIRNQTMLWAATLADKNTTVLAFPGGAGTKNCIEHAKKLQLNVVENLP